MALAVVFAILASCGFASGSVLIRVGTQNVSAVTATFLTVITGAVLIGSLALALEYSEITSLTLVALGWIALMGFMAYPMARVLLNSAISMVGATRAVPMGSVQPLIAFGLGVLLLGERPSLLVTLGTPVIVVGLLLVVLPRGGGIGGRILSYRNLGYLMALGAASTFASRDVISRHVLGGITSPLVASGLALVIGCLMLFAVAHRDVVRNVRGSSPRYLAVCVAAGVFQGLAVASVFQALSRAPVTVVSPIYACTPIITLILAHLFLRRLESIDLLLAAGTCISVAGVAMVVLGASG